MSKLRDLLETQVSRETADEKYRTIVIERLEEDIKQEILQEEAVRVVKAEEKERLLRNADHIKDAFWTVVVIGTLVGVAANQFTEMVSLAKTNLVHTIFVAALLFVIMYIFFWIRYIRKASDEIRKFKEKNNA